MILDELKLHLEVLQSKIDIAKSENSLLTIHDREYMLALHDIIDRFKRWRAEAYIHVEKGCVEALFANCDLIVNLWDNDAEKMSEDNVDEYTYRERLEEWTESIKLLLDKHEIKKVL